MQEIATRAGVRTRYAGGAGSRQSMTWYVPSRVPCVSSRHSLAAWLGVLAVLSLGGCGTQTGVTTDSADPSGTKASPAQTQAHADALFEAIAGDAVEREAVHFLEFEQLNRSFNECMAGKGFQVPSGYLPIWTGYQANGTSGEWMGALGRKPSTMALATAESTRAEYEAVDPESVVATDGYQEAVAGCSTDEPVVDLGNRPGVPDGAEDLRVAFRDLVESVDAKLGPIDSYRKCMNEAGFDLPAGGAQGWQGLYNYLTGKMPLAPLPGEKPDALWSQYLELESAALSADATCRTEKYQEGLALLAPLLDKFESAHADEIARVDASWQSTVREASEVGFNPGA